MIQQSGIKPVIPYLFFYLVVFALSANNPFFWDSIYFSKIAHFYYEKGFGNLILPTDLDQGHPPFFGIYLTILWKYLGKNLFVSHFAVLPFVLGTIWQLFILARRFFKGCVLHIVMLLVCIEPSFLAHSTIPSNDLALVFFYLLGLNSVIKNRRLLLFISLMGMAAMSLRGIVAVGGIFITEAALLFFIWEKENRKPDFKLLLPYIGAGLVIGGWLYFHYLQTGWLASTPSPNWSGGRKAIGIDGYLKNIIIIIWRSLDYGRLGLWLMVFVAIVYCSYKFKELIKYKDLQQLIIFTFAPFIILSLSFIPVSNPIGHRYFLVFFLLFTLVAAWIILHCTKGWKRNILIIIAILCLITGHFWVYPAKTPQGWDSTLAHLPYFDLRKKMINYVFENKLDPQKIGTSFPNIDGTRFTDLDNTNWKFVQRDLVKDQYIIESNIFNDFTDEALDELQNNWLLQKEFRENQIYIRLYKNRRHKITE